MLPNLFRQSFWAVFVPLTLVAGLFWLSEIRGYRAEMSLFVLPKTAFAEKAATNLAALSREIPFALAAYASEPALVSPLMGKTVAERRALWSKAVQVETVVGSDVIRITTRGSDQAEALTLVKAVTAELVRTASRYYNQKTDVDIRVIAEPVATPSFTAWPRFLVATFSTSIFFTVLFFIIHGLIDRLFPRIHLGHNRESEYTISPDTFKPRVPAYWSHEDKTATSEPKAPVEPAIDMAAHFREDIQSFSPASPEPVEPAPVEASPSLAYVAEAESVESNAEEVSAREHEAIVAEPVSEPINGIEPEPMATEALPYAGYATHAAAPDNLPIYDGPITPLQGAQARLLKLDIDAQAESLSADAAIEELDRTLEPEPAAPKTHEPTPDEYKRRLNELLSGKM